MFLQSLLCCGTCQGSSQSDQKESSLALSDNLPPPTNKLVERQGQRAVIRMGEIVKLLRDDKMPFLEVNVQIENDVIQKER